MKYFILPLLIIGFLTPFTTRAFTINPARYVVTADPGTAQRVEITITNTEKQKEIFTLGVLGARQDERGRPEFGRGISKAEQWVMPELLALEVAPGQKKKVYFIAQVPPDAEPGQAHYLGLTVTRSAAPGQQIGLSSELVTLLTLQISGTVREEVQIAEWQSRKSVLFKLPVRMTARLQNSGTASVPLQVEASIRSLLGRVLHTQAMPAGNELIAGSSRRFESNLQTSLWPGIYRVKLAVQYGFTHQSIASNVTVVYAPWWSIMLLLIVVAGGYGAVRYRRS